MSGEYLKALLNKKPNIKYGKPCYKLGFCPYGPLVEEFPLIMPRTDISCKTFGHNCPVFYCGEDMIEEEGVQELDSKKEQGFLSWMLGSPSSREDTT